MTIIITLSFAGNETGPFDLYSDATNFATPFAQGISKAALLAGFQVNAPAGTTVVRLDDLSGLCLNTETDIYTCATPNCDFVGEILCNITTTTTSTSSSTTTTTSTAPSAGLCLWSTNGGNPGSVAVYSFETNTSNEVLVPNDFESTVGVNRPMCSTSTKLYLLSVKDSSTYQYLREWDITVSSPGAVPTLTYVREFRIQPGSIPYTSSVSGDTNESRKITAIAVSNNILMVALGTPSEETYRLAVVTWELPAVGEPILILRYITQSPSTTQPARSYSTVSLSYGNQSAPGTSRYLTEITSMWMANSGDVMLNFRLDEKLQYNETESVGNWLKQMKGIPPANSSLNDQYEWSLNSNLSTLIYLQDSGVPEFVSYVGVKAMPTWGTDNLLQVLQPETLVVYTIDQSLPHAATIATTVIDENVWLSSANGCANVILPEGFGSCIPTNLPQLTVDGLGAPGQAPLSYLGPQTFQYGGQTVTASSIIWQGIAGYNDAGYNQQALDFVNDCGITFTGETIPGDELTRTVTFGRNGQGGNQVNTPAFDYTLEFEYPITSLRLKFNVLNSWSSNSGDFFKFDVNNGTPTISIVEGCDVELTGPNTFGAVPGTISPAPSGSAVIEMQSTEPFTTFTLTGTNNGAGGPVWLDCATPALNCLRIFTSRQYSDCSDTAGICAPENLFPAPAPDNFYNRLYAQNTVTNNIEEIVLPAGTYFQSGNSDITNNYFISQVNNIDPNTGAVVQQFSRWEYTNTSINGVPSNFTWEGILYTIDAADIPQSIVAGLSTINDNLIVLGGGSFAVNSGDYKVYEAKFVEGSTILEVTFKFLIPDPFNGYGEHVVTLKEDGTPNKFIAQKGLGSIDEPFTLAQFDYDTGNFEVEILGPESLMTNPNGAGDMAVVDDYLYQTLKSPANVVSLFRCNLQTHVWEQVSDSPEYDGGSSGSLPSCRTNDGFAILGTTTTTSSTTPNPSGAKTIWTWFESELNS